MKPFPPWLEGEMRSNHAGETGAVAIYEGAIKALDIRRGMGLSYGDIRKGQSSYEDRLRKFAAKHRDSEQSHVDLLEALLDGEHMSVLLPAWRIAGFTLGFASTMFCPRGMYLTTEAVETFVEEHYMSQIRRLRYEAAEQGLCGAYENVSGTRTSLNAHAELIAMLEHCCEDEVHHKEEARSRAAEGPFPWFELVDTSWQWFVQTGSAAAANCAKRL
jgi:ubiquinone biosynthesis monooxygenase Coq7